MWLREKQFLCPLATLLFFKSKLINAYQHPLSSSSPSLICVLPSFLSSLCLFSLLLLLPPVRDDFFGKAPPCLMVIFAICFHFPPSCFFLSIFFGFIFTFCATDASHILYTFYKQFLWMQTLKHRTLKCLFEEKTLWGNHIRVKRQSRTLNQEKQWMYLFWKINRLCGEHQSNRKSVSPSIKIWAQ